MKGVHETTLRPNSTEGTNIILYQQKDWVGGQVHIFFCQPPVQDDKKKSEPALPPSPFADTI